jgi:cell division protein FtsB
MKPPIASDPAIEQSAKDLTDQLQSAIKNNTLIEMFRQRSTQIQTELIELENKITQLRLEQSSIRAEWDDLEQFQDLKPLNEQLNDLEKINKRAREVIEYKKTKDILYDIEVKVSALEADMELCSIEKDEALESVDLPIQDLRINAEGIEIKDQEGNYVPLKQASAARGLKLSTAIAMALNPTLRVIRITDGSLLDDDSMAILEEMADNTDTQIWIEQVSKNDNDKPGIFISDGEVAS